MPEILATPIDVTLKHSKDNIPPLSAGSLTDAPPRFRSLQYPPTTTSSHSRHSSLQRRPSKTHSTASSSPPSLHQSPSICSDPVSEQLLSFSDNSTVHFQHQSCVKTMSSATSIIIDNDVHLVTSPSPMHIELSPILPTTNVLVTLPAAVYDSDSVYGSSCNTVKSLHTDLTRATTLNRSVKPIDMTIKQCKHLSVDSWLSETSIDMETYSHLDMIKSFSGQQHPIILHTPTSNHEYVEQSKMCHPSMTTNEELMTTIHMRQAEKIKIERPWWHTVRHYLLPCWY